MIRKKRNLIRMGALSTIGGLMILPMVSGKVRKKIGRSGRNAFFIVSDYLQDIVDMRR